MLVSENEERQMGLRAYREVLSKESLSYDAQTNALVEKVGRRIAAAAAPTCVTIWSLMRSAPWRAMACATSCPITTARPASVCVIGKMPV